MLFYVILYEGFKKYRTVSSPKYSKSARCPEYRRVSSGTDSGTSARTLPRNPHQRVRACLPYGHTLAAPPTCSYYLNELIKPPSNYLSYTERRTRRGQTIRSTGIIETRIFPLRLILSFAPDLPSSRSSFISFTAVHSPMRSCADNGVLSRLEKTQLAYLRTTVRLFENRKIRKSQEKLNGLVSANSLTRQWVYRGRSPPRISFVFTNMIQRALCSQVFY